MMPLALGHIGETLTIAKIKGKDETTRFLCTLGFAVGDDVTIVSENRGNLIVNVKDARIAIDQDMARRIMVN